MLREEFRAAFFAAPVGRRVEPVETAFGTVHVRELMTGEKDAFDTTATKDKMFRARLVVACCCDEQGRPMFSESDVHSLNQRPLAQVEPIVDAAMRLNGMRAEDAGLAEKNSEAGPGDSSSSGSPAS
jgi:hypothetical protein